MSKGDGGGMIGNGVNGETAGIPFRRGDPYASLRTFRFTGIIELIYQDYSTKAPAGHSGWRTFEYVYRIGMKGYIYDPRLAIFDAAISYRNQRTDTKEGSDEWKSKNINYEINTIFLPTRPISFNVYASKINTTVEGMNLSQNDTSITFYGARLWSTKKKYPMIRLEYNHWDYTIDRISGQRLTEEELWEYDYDSDEERPYIILKKRVKQKTKIDRYSFDMSGDLKFMKTRYSLSGALSEYSSPLREYSAQFFRSSTLSKIIKQNIFSTYVYYSKIDPSTLLSLATHLDLSPIKNFYHSYSYEYLTSKTESDETTSQTISGLWRLRLSRTIHGKADLRYKITESDNVNEDSYAANLNMNYGRPLKGYEFYSSYLFSVGKEERNGEFQYMYNTLRLNLTTKKIKSLKIYTDYDFTYRTLDFKPDINISATTGKSEDIEQRFRIGVTGRGPGRISWTVELEARFLDTKETGDGAWRSVWFGENQYAQKIRHYTPSGTLAFPIGRRGDVSLKASYTFGTTNSESVRTYYYEGRLRYRILKTMNLTAWLREDWRNKGWWAGSVTNTSIDYDWKERQYEVTLNYLWRKLTMSLEYTVIQTEQDSVSTEVRRFYLRLSRKF